MEDFTKPLSLSFRLFGNILADELVVAVLSKHFLIYIFFIFYIFLEFVLFSSAFIYIKLVSLVPLIIPIPLIFLGLFTSGIQALIFATLSGSLRNLNLNSFFILILC